MPEAIAVHRRLDTTISERHHDRVRIKSNLASLLAAKAELDGDVEIGNEAIERGREAVELTPENSPMRALRLSNVAAALAMLGELTSDGAVLTEAADQLREVVDRAPDGSELHCSSLIALGRCLVKTAALGPGDDEPAEAIAVLRLAVGLTRKEDALRPAALAELATALKQGKHSTEAAIPESATVAAKISASRSGPMRCSRRRRMTCSSTATGCAGAGDAGSWSGPPFLPGRVLGSGRPTGAAVVCQ